MIAIIFSNLILSIGVQYLRFNNNHKTWQAMEKKKTGHKSSRIKDKEKSGDMGRDRKQEKIK